MAKKAKVKAKAKSKMKLKKRSPAKAKKTVKKKKTVKRTVKKVQAVPKGYNSITPYLIVNECRAAIEFYKSVFGAKEVMRMEQADGKIGHAELKIGDARIMLADEFPDMFAKSPHAFGGTPVSIHLYIKDVDMVVDRALTSGARMLKPVATMFWGDRMGVVEDPFGHKWAVATHIEDVTPAQMKKRMAEQQPGHA